MKAHIKNDIFLIALFLLQHIELKYQEIFFCSECSWYTYYKPAHLKSLHNLMDVYQTQHKLSLLYKEQLIFQIQISIWVLETLSIWWLDFIHSEVSSHSVNSKSVRECLDTSFVKISKFWKFTGVCVWCFGLPQLTYVFVLRCKVF